MTTDTSNGATRSVWDALRDNPQWRKLYAARTASLFGNWFNTLAIVHLLGQGQHHSALALAAVFILKQLPNVLLGPLAGVVVDRVDRRKLMIVCDLLDAGLALAFLLTEPGGSLTYIYVLAGLQMGVSAFFEPAQRSMVPSLVRDDDLVAANALSSVTWSVVFALGTALGGVLLATVGWEAAMIVDAATYVASALLLVWLRYEAPEREESTRPRSVARVLGIHDFREGLKYILGNRPIRHLIAVKFSWGFMGALTLFLTLLGMRPDFHIRGSPDLGVAFLWTARAVGTGIGPFLARWYGRDRNDRLRKTIAFGYLLAIGCYLLVPLSISPWQAAGLVLVAHIGGSMVWVMSTVLLQKQVPEPLRGRTFAAEFGLVMLTSSLSHFVYGVVLDFGLLELRSAITAATCVFTIPVGWWIWAELRDSRRPAS
jgi:hypothetical protein